MNGVEYIVYNNSYAYDHIENLKMKRAGRVIDVQGNQLRN